MPSVFRITQDWIRKVTEPFNGSLFRAFPQTKVLIRNGLFSENVPVSEKSFNLSGRCILWFAEKTHSQGRCVSRAAGLLALVVWILQKPARVSRYRKVLTISAVIKKFTVDIRTSGAILQPMIYIVWKEHGGSKAIVGSYNTLVRAMQVREENARTYGMRHSAPAFYIQSLNPTNLVKYPMGTWQFHQAC